MAASAAVALPSRQPIGTAGADQAGRAEETSRMPRYVVLYRFTDSGRKQLKETVHRASEIRELNEAAGFDVLAHYWTQGHYDLVTVVDAPSEEAMMNGLFSIAEAGNVSSETLRAFTDEEMQRIIGPA
ncbi:MAG: GYD domain-containing protein [Chloroflexi bacterium]|nr:GYD domain-containing protein [Chloroflexota bacterium]MYI83026.1 GYD domain-containing protein [Chloroflexota bacterium]